MRKHLAYFLLASIILGRVSGRSEAASNDRWQWLNNTYWYVPDDYLPAIASNPAVQNPLSVSDQTVYYIEQYQAGYFWGITAVTYQAPQGSASQPATCLQIVGSVTPQGKLHLTFTPLASQDLSSEPTIGIGVMARKPRGWTMENQMSTVAVGNLLLTHWAYMYQCKPQQPCFSSLPGVGVSLPEFLSPCVTPPSVNRQ